MGGDGGTGERRTAYQRSGHIVRKKNDPFDHYETPAWATEALIRRERFEGGILEPCAGSGAMSRVLEAAGYAVDSTDIRRDEVYGTGGMDFLRREEPADNVVTNPPFNQAEAMVRQALRIARYKIAFLLKLDFLSSQDRYVLFRSTPLRTVYVFSKRPGLAPPGVTIHGGGMINYAWYVWQQGYTGGPILDWINSVEVLAEGRSLWTEAA